MLLDRLRNLFHRLSHLLELVQPLIAVIHLQGQNTLHFFELTLQLDETLFKAVTLDE